MKRRPSCLVSLTLVTLFALCVLTILAVIVTLAIPRLAAQTFGQPSSRLGTTQQLTYAALLVLQEQSLTRPVDPAGSPRPFRVELGEPTASVIQRLYNEGFIASAEAFRTYLLYSGLDTSVQAGDYRLSQAMNAIQIAHELQDATPEHVTFRVLAGWRLEEIAAALPTSGLDISSEEFLASAHIPRTGYIFSDSLPHQGTLEGFFFPGTYEMTRTLTLEGFIRVTLDNFQAYMTPDLIGGFSNQGLDIYSAVTLASIVEREAVVDAEMPMIAGVFYNRLAAGMKLDSDPTVQYALGFNQTQSTWWTNPLSLVDLDIDSPFNTYKYPGLPPRPIASPGATALKAVAFPESSPYLYFRAACDGSGRHVFAKTFEEHVANACP
jgi:UPF0755 protein